MSAKRVLSQKHKGKKGLAAFLFSRFFLFGLMVVLQVLMFVFFAYNASVEKNLNYVIMVLQFVLIIYIANDKSGSYNETGLDNVYYVCTGYWLYDVSLFYASTGFSYAKKET